MQRAFLTDVSVEYGVDMRDANLTDVAGISNRELDQTGGSPQLNGATMPNGQKYEEWREKCPKPTKACLNDGLIKVI